MRLPAHRLVLASSSRYFQSLLYTSDGPKLDRDVALVGVTADDIRLFLRIIYGGVTSITVAQLSSMLRLSALYECPIVAKHVSSLLSMMTADLSLDTVCTLFNSAVTLGVYILHYPIIMMMMVCRSIVGWLYRWIPTLDSSISLRMLQKW